MQCTIFKNITSPDEPYYITVDDALKRIKTGKQSRERVEQIRETIDDSKQQDLKKNLPSVCFSGKFSKRADSCLIEHSGFIVLDFDHVNDVSETMGTMCSNPYVYAAWISPRANGVKTLIRIADGSKHRQHFTALKKLFPDADNSGINESRVCYESYDPNIYINKKSEIFTQTLEQEKIVLKETVTDERLIFDKLLKWLSNKGNSFAKGERNIFMFKLASSCCRFGLDENSTASFILNDYPTGNDFTQKEAYNTIRSAYRCNKNKMGDARFEKDILIEKTTSREIKLEDKPTDHSNDIVYGISVKDNALAIYNHGYEKVSGIGVPLIDDIFKSKRGELTCITGIGNMGKSVFYKWYFLMRVLIYGEKFGVFPPEDFPPEEYYHDYVEMLLGCACTPDNHNRPSINHYNNAYDFVSNHIFCVSPKDGTPTPDYVLECYLELIIKEKIDGVCTDPWNRLVHKYAYSQRVDEYLASELNKFNRFGMVNNIYNFVIAHPNKMTKLPNGNYPCPDKFDLNGGAMWNNMLDNLLVYHRPEAQSNPNGSGAEFHTKKIKRQKSVGKADRVIGMDYIRDRRRFEINGFDYMGAALSKHDLSFHKPILNYCPKPKPELAEQTKKFLEGYQLNSQNFTDTDKDELQF